MIIKLLKSSLDLILIKDLQSVKCKKRFKGGVNMAMNSVQKGVKQNSVKKAEYGYCNFCCKTLSMEYFFLAYILNAQEEK